MSTEEPEDSQEPPKAKPLPSSISQYLAKIGRQGGLKGGKARNEALSKKRKSEIAKKAAKARWGKNST